MVNKDLHKSVALLFAIHCATFVLFHEIVSLSVGVAR